MKKITTIFCVFFPLLVLWLPFSASGQVKIILRSPSSPQFLLSDLWNVNLTNLTTSSKTVYLVGTVKDANQTLVVTVTSNSFSLAAGSHSYSSADITTANIDYLNSELQQILSQTGQFPSGSYLACVTVFDADITDVTELDKSCIENIVELINPPHLVYPLDASEVNSAYPVFTWTNASPIHLGQHVDYRMKVVELYENQSAEEGMLENLSFFEGDMSDNLLYSYGYEHEPFEENKWYAWQITASIGDYVIGGSEVWKFSYRPAAVDSATIGLHDNYLLLKSKTDGGYYQASGSIKFRYSDDYLTGIKNVKIMTPSRGEVTQQGIEMKRPFNDDRYVIDLKNIQELEHLKYYLLEVQTNSGTTYTIRFKYLDPDAGL
jgi:hypothetical protein